MIRLFLRTSINLRNHLVYFSVFFNLYVYASFAKKISMSISKILPISTVSLLFDSGLLHSKELATGILKIEDYGNKTGGETKNSKHIVDNLREF